MYEVKEQDWKLFRQRLPGWQEAYMGKLTQEYLLLLAGEGSAADRFWALDKRIRMDKKSTGVLARDVKRSNMVYHLVDLLADGAITGDDLKEFSGELRGVLGFLMHEEY